MGDTAQSGAAPTRTTDSGGEPDKPALVRVKKEPQARREQSDDPFRGPSTGATSTTSAAGKAQTSETLRNGQQVITSYFSSKGGGNEMDSKNATGVVSKSEASESEEKSKTPPIDLESIRGIFGWSTLEGVHIPFILRQGDKYTAVRVIERSLLKKYLQALPPDVYSCTYIKSYFITGNEAKLLNEINMKHCDRQFGNEHFTAKDLVVQLIDVVQLYKFLSTCYEKLIRKASSSSSQSPVAFADAKCDPCGIVKIDGTPVPYVTRDETKYVPLSLFEAQMQSLETKAEKLEHWEMAYLKFCCRVANIGHKFLEQNVPLVVSLDDVKQLADASVNFIDWWPSVNLNHSHQALRSADKCKELLSTANQSCLPLQQRHPVPTAMSYYEDGFRKNVQPEVGSKMTVATPQNESRPMSSKSSVSTVGMGIKEGQMDLSVLRFPYPLHEAPATPLPAHNPKPYIFNEQWSGPVVSRSFMTSTNVPQHRTMPAHSSQAPTQSTPSNLPYVTATHNPIYDYLQGLQQIMTKDGWRLPFQSPESRFSTPRKITSSNHSAFSKNTVNLEQNGYPYWALENFQQKSRTFPIAGGHSSNLSGGFDHISEKSPHNNRSLHGTSTSLCNPTLPPEVEAEHGMLLAQHLARIDEALYKRTALHQHVVAPSVGNSQCMTGKMASPKLAHQVPTSVTSNEGLAYHSRAALDKSVTSNTFSAASKLQELLQANESNGAIKVHRLDSLSCDIKEVVIGGIRFSGVYYSSVKGSSTLMVPVKEIEMKVKPCTAVYVCEHILRKILKVELFECNRGQGEILRKKLKYSKDLQRTSTLNLIRADDLKICLSRLVNALTQLQTRDDRASAPVSKKARHMGVSI